MLNKKKYLIRTHKLNSSIESEGATIDFQFVDEDGKATITFESQIGDFIAYDQQLQAQLKKLNFKTRPWSKNIMYFSIANNLDEVQIRCFFDSANFVGAAETYLLKENVAIQLSTEFQHTQNDTICIFGIYNSKIEFSVMKDLGFKFIKTLYADQEIMSQVNNFNQLVENILHEIKSKFKISSYYLFSEKGNTAFHDMECLKSFKRIDNRNELIMEGLRVAAEKEGNQFYMIKKT